MARRGEITRLLGLRPDVRELKVDYGAYSGREDEIDMKTRSMLEIMLEFAAGVEVPDADVAEGKATPRCCQFPAAAHLREFPCGSLLETPLQRARMSPCRIRPVVLDCRQRYPIQNDVRHCHAAVFDCRYRHKRGRTGGHNPRQSMSTSRRKNR